MTTFRTLVVSGLAVIVAAAETTTSQQRRLEGVSFLSVEN